MSQRDWCWLKVDISTLEPWWNRTLRSNAYSDNRPLAPVCKHLKNTWTFNWAWEWYGSPQNVVNTKMQLFISSAANSFKLFIWRKKKWIHHYIFNHRDEIEKRNAFGRVGGVCYSQNWSGIVAPHRQTFRKLTLNEFIFNVMLIRLLQKVHRESEKVWVCVEEKLNESKHAVVRPSVLVQCAMFTLTLICG